MFCNSTWVVDRLLKQGNVPSCNPPQLEFCSWLWVLGLARGRCGFGRVHQVHSLEVIDHKSSKGPGSWDGHKKQGLDIPPTNSYKRRMSKRGKKQVRSPGSLNLYIWVYLHMFVQWRSLWAKNHSTLAGFALVQLSFNLRGTYSPGLMSFVGTVVIGLL